MKRLLVIVGAVAVLLIGAVVALPFLIDPNQYRSLLESKVSEALGRQVTVGNLKLELFQGSVAAEELSIGEDPAFGTTPFLRAQSVHVGVELRPLIFERKLNVTQVAIDKPEVRIASSESGRWNFASLGKKGTAAPAAAEPESKGSGLDLSVRSVKIADGEITLSRAGTKDQVLHDIDIELRDLSLTSALGFSVTAKRPEGGSIKVEGKAGPLNASKGELPPVEAKFEVPSLDLVAAGLVDSATGVAGVVSFSGAAKTKGNVAEMTGNLRAEKLKLVAKGSPAGRPVELEFAVSHDVTRRVGRLSRANIHIGQAVATLAGTYNLAGATPTIAMKFSGDKMPLTELAAMLPAMNVVLPVGATIEAGTLSLSADVAGPLGRFSSTGPVSVDSAKLANYDLGTKLRVIQMLTGIPATPTTEIQNLSAMVNRTPEGTSIENINMMVPTIGNLSGAGTIGADNSLDFKMRTTLHTSGGVMSAVGQKGDTTVPFLITGTSANPVFKPDVRAIATEKLEQFKKDPGKSVQAVKDIFDSFRRKPKTEPTQK